MPSKGSLSSTLIATKPPAGTDTDRPDIRYCVPAQPVGAFRVTVKVAGSPGLARGALSVDRNGQDQVRYGPASCGPNTSGSVDAKR
jgi:hypothetical protein